MSIQLPRRDQARYGRQTHIALDHLKSVAIDVLPMINSVRAIGLFCFLLLSPGISAREKLKTENVFLIVSDGFRWQEVFTGAEQGLISKESGGVKNTNALQAEFGGGTPEQRRAALLPFFWNEIARHGQILGNQARGSVVTVTNGRKFSYPGYNEMITGFGDPKIDSNDKNPNLNTNVFEWLNQQPRMHGRVAILGTWDAFPYIFNCERSHLPIWPSWEKKFGSLTIAAPPAVRELMPDTNSPWEDLTYDSFLIQTAVHYLKHKKPRATFIGFGETDEWAHAGRYDVYLAAAHHFDEFVRRLWETAQSISQYRNKTTFIITADHGRGTGPDWKNHGEKTQGAEGIWIAVIGPDTPALGERTQTEPHTQSQIAATIAALLGYDFNAASPKSARPVLDLFSGANLSK